MSAPTPPPPPDEAPERETSPVELLWDLVFVFAVTQVTTLLAARPSWGRFGQAMLVLALIWWAWSAFVWASNALDAESRVLRGFLLVATVLIFIAGLALPHAFGDEALLFVVAHGLVRAVHMKLYVDAARAGRAGHRHGDRADPGAVRARFAERPASLGGRHRRRPPRSHCHRARGSGR